MYTGKEKRQYERIEKPFIVKLQTIPDEPKERISPDWDMVVSKDLGAGGVFFYSSKNLRIGTALDFKIGFSTSSPPVECVGIVIRVKEQPYTSIFGIAAAFTKIDKRDREMINKTALDISRLENHNLKRAYA
ncbi:MAG: PilZ domain-containing protein [Candidatus Scalinduaceae bacterium]